MRKYLYLVLIALLAFTGVSYAVDGDQTTQVGFRVGADGDVVAKSVTSSAGIIRGLGAVELVTTSDTLLSTETGTTYVYTGTINSTFTLPAATTLGTEFTFVNGYSSGDSVSVLFIDPASVSDEIVYTSMAWGDALQSPSSPASGDTVTIISGGNNEWYIKNMFRTWQDGN